MSFIPTHVFPPGRTPTTVYVTIVRATGPIYIGGDSIATLNDGQRPPAGQGNPHYGRQAGLAHVNPLWAAGDTASRGHSDRHARPGHAETPQPSPGGAIKRSIVEHTTLPEHPIEPWPPSGRANKVDPFGLDSLPWPPALTSIRDPVEEETFSEDPIEPWPPSERANETGSVGVDALPWPPSGDKKKRGRYALGANEDTDKTFDDYSIIEDKRNTEESDFNKRIYKLH